MSSQSNTIQPINVPDRLVPADNGVPRAQVVNVPMVLLTKMQYNFITELVLDGKPELWNWRKYINSFAVGVGYSPQAVDSIRNSSNVWFTARCMLNKRPIIVYIENELTKMGNRRDPDIDRKPGQELYSFKMERFCQEIVADPVMSARKAAKRAGYGNMGEYGYKLLMYKKVRDRIDELIDERKERLKANQDEVIANLVRLSRINMADFVSRFDGNSVVFNDSNTISRDDMYGIKRIKQTVRGLGQNTVETFSIQLEDKFKPNELLAKHLGLVDNNNYNLDPVEFAVQLRQLSRDIANKVPGGVL